MLEEVVNGHRSLTAGVLAVGGGALAIATWIGGAHGIAVVVLCIYVVLTVGAWVWSGRDSDVAAIMRADGDERQRRIDRDATALSGLAMGLVAVLGAIASAALNEGDIGPWGVVAAVGGATYAISLFVLQRRT
jgi:hypothetical protein